jgi:AraC-like DNA-binding protein
LFVTTTGAGRIRPHAPYPPQGHPEGYAFEWSRGRTLHDHQVVYISRGRGRFESRPTRAQFVEAGTAFLLFPGVWHRYAPDAETGWAEHWVGVSGAIARAWVKQGFFSPAEPFVRIRQEERLLALYDELIEAVKLNQPALQQVLAGVASHILALLYSDRQARLAGDDAALAPIRQVIHRMRANPACPLDLPELARQLNISYSAFRRGFTHHTGLSPHQYLLELRLARARNLLGETTLAVKEVAAASGFTDEHYFCRLFRQRTGSRPTAWRERAQGAVLRTGLRRGGKHSGAKPDALP